MAPMSGSFDARQFEPNQGGGGHTLGKFIAKISNTSIKPNKSNDGGMLNVEFTSDGGTIANNYNLWNKNPQAVEIAHKELSALCYATGIFQLDYGNDAAALRGAQCMIEVVDQVQKGEKTGYVEIKKIYDVKGNEPGKTPVVQTAAQPLTQQNNGGWGNPAPQTNNPTTQQPNPNPAPSQSGWVQGNQQQPNNPGAGGTNPPAQVPWGNPR